MEKIGRDERKNGEERQRLREASRDGERRTRAKGGKNEERERERKAVANKQGW